MSMTKALSSSLLAGVLTALVLCQPARADAPKPATKGETHVVLVGISQYADKQIKPRPDAENDVKALHALFSNKDYFSADIKNVKLLLGSATDKETQATRANFLKVLKGVAD